MGGNGAEPKRSILLGECSDDLQFDVRAQVITSIASVEVHDIRHVTPRTLDRCNTRAFMDLALSHRPEGSLVHFPEVVGHQTRRFGELFFIPAHVRWQGQWNGGAQRSICIMFSEDGTALNRDWTATQLDTVLDLREKVLRETMIRMASELECPGFESTLMIETFCTQIAIILHRHVDQPQNELRPCGRLASHQLRSIEEMLDRDGPAPSLAEFAARCELSPRHFGRLFRITTGQSLTEFAVTRRTRRAEDLLGNTSMPIKQVAWACGFQTAAAFSVAFRRETGLQPIAFRNLRRH